MTDHEQVKQFYDQEYYTHPLARGHVLPWHMRRVAARFAPLEGKAVLDVACGAGTWLAELQRRGATASGIDISEKAAALAREQLPQADIRCGVAESLPFRDAVFDLVTCMGSLEHFLDQPKALREMLRVGKPSATFLVLVPNSGFLTRRLGLYRGTGQTAICETVRSTAEWTVIFRDAGLRVRAMWRDLHPLGREWIRQGPPHAWPLRAAQAAALCCWPVRWQYQIYFVLEGSRDA